MDFKTVDELLKYTDNIKGKTFRELDKDNLLQKNKKDKGNFGKIIETGFYGYPNNNKAEADFNDLGVELKVSGYIKNKNGTVSAKERLVLSKIDYNSIVNEEFNYSKLLFKNKKILIIWYEYDKEKDMSDFIITDYQLYDMSGDEIVIKNDFEIIKEKVLEGYAHLLSEGDTSYLGACTKGATSDDKTKQPFSSIPAKPRAFSLKNSYMTGILRSLDLTFTVDNLEYKTIDEYVYAQVKKFIGKTQTEIYFALSGIEYKNDIPKNIGKMISDKAIGKDKELPEKNDLFRKTNYIIKNLPVDNNDYPLERMSFRNLTLSDFKDEWENSWWKTYFEEVTIIVLCYEGSLKIRNGFRKLKDIKKITFNSDDIDVFGRTYNMVKQAIDNKDITKLPYPNSFSGQILEVAPKGIKGDNAYINLFKSDTTKVCFMMNKDFLFSKLYN